MARMLSMNKRRNREEEKKVWRKDRKRGGEKRRERNWRVIALLLCVKEMSRMTWLTSKSWEIVWVHVCGGIVHSWGVKRKSKRRKGREKGSRREGERKDKREKQKRKENQSKRDENNLWDCSSMSWCVKVIA
jgi:hypothetical protein